MTRRLVVAVCVIGSVCLAAPAAAVAGTASSDGTTITYTAAAGEANDVEISPGTLCTAAPPAGQFCVRDNGAPVTAAGSCSATADPNEAHCPGSRFVADLGDMDDTGAVDGSIPSEILGGSGV